MFCIFLTILRQYMLNGDDDILPYKATQLARRDTNVLRSLFLGFRLPVSVTIILFTNSLASPV